MINREFLKIHIIIKFDKSLESVKSTFPTLYRPAHTFRFNPLQGCFVPLTRSVTYIVFRHTVTLNKFPSRSSSKSMSGADDFSPVVVDEDPYWRINQVIPVYQRIHQQFLEYDGWNFRYSGRSTAQMHSLLNSSRCHTPVHSTHCDARLSG